MALTDESGANMVMPVAPMQGNFGGGMPYPYPVFSGMGQGGNGGFGNDQGW